MDEILEKERADRHAQRARERKRKLQEKRRRQLRRLLPLSAAAVVLLIFLGTRFAGSRAVMPAESAEMVPASAQEPETPKAPPVYSAEETEGTRELTDEVASEYAILIDVDSGTILAEKNAQTKISPASMTKIMTVLVAAEHVTNLDDTAEMTRETADECYRSDCSVAGFEVGEQVPVRDLFYGTILPSGADAALTLANYVAGSQEAFAGLMNDKLEELGLSDTAHFTNCIGVYDPDHFCTVYDMAMILKAAEDNPLCPEVLSTHVYTTASTQQHPDGLTLSNWFLRRIEDKDTGGLTVLGAKTGYVTQSGSCAASYAAGDSGPAYLCVTGNAYSSWRCIYDHAALYQQAKELAGASGSRGD